MIKKIAACVGEYKRPSILAPIYMIGEVTMDVLIPYLMAFMIDKGLNQSDLSYVLKIGVAMLALTALGMFFGVQSGKYAAIAGTGLAKNLRSTLFRRVQTFSFENIDKFSTASLVTRLTTDVSNVQNAYQMIIRMLVRAPMTMVLALFMSFLLSVKLSLIFVAAIPILMVAVYFIVTNAHQFFMKLFRTYDKLNAVVQENLVGMRTVKAYVREDYEINKFGTISQRIVDLSKGAEKMIILLNPVMFIVVYGCIIICSLLGAKFIIHGELTTGALMSLFTYAVQILSSIMMVSMILVQCVMAKASVERIVEVLDEEAQLKNCEEPVENLEDGSIEFDHVSFSYSHDEKNCVLSDVNFKIKSGQTVGILGGTGSAKSSLVQLIPRLYDVTIGSVKVGGVDVREIDMEVLRENVSMVLQKNVLFSGTVNSNMRWGDLEATDQEIKEACELAQADEFVQTFENQYEARIDQGGNNVSGGQKQRLCIARAILKKPKILILDDSTSAVDMKTDALIRRAFEEKIPDTTKIIIAQRVASVEQADQIIILNDGKIDGIGTHQELLRTNQIYKEVYESQKQGGDDHAA